MVFKIIILFILLLTAIHSAFAENLGTIIVESSSVFENESTSYEAHRIIRPVSKMDRDLSESVKKISGTQVKSNSGVGSLTTIVSPDALNASSTQLSIDEIPIPDPSGLGINLSLIPAGVSKSVELRSVFYITDSPFSVQSRSHGSRLNMNTQGLAVGSNPNSLSGNIRYGSAQTLHASTVYEGGNENTDYLFGVNWSSTKGNFQYRVPETGDSKIRENNDSAGASILAKLRHKTSSTGKVESIALLSKLDRTNPGPISFSTRDHERDQFQLLGASFSDPKLFSENTGVTSMVSGSINRVQNMISDQIRTDAHTSGIYAMAGMNTNLNNSKYDFSVDENIEKMNDGTGREQRSTFGINAQSKYEFNETKAFPRLRLENTNGFGNIFDGFLVIEIPHIINEKLTNTLGYGYHHQLPPIMALTGYNAGGILVYPNHNIKVERDSTFELNSILGIENFTFSNRVFYNFIQDRAVYNSISFISARYESVPRASIFGDSLGVHYDFSENISVDHSLTLLRAWDRMSGREFPYKSRLSHYSNLTVKLTKKVSGTIEESWVGKRLINMTDSQSISPMFQTNLKLNWNLAKNSNLCFSIRNLLNEGDYVSAGYPAEGRSYDLGLQISAL